MSFISRARLIALLLLLAMPLPGAAQGSISVEDSVAGLSVHIGLHGLTERAAYAVVVTPPRGPAIEQTAKTDAEGEGDVLLPPEATDTAGTYRVEVLDQDTETKLDADFEILPERMDHAHSRIIIDRPSIDPDGWDELEVRVRLEDRYGNPLGGRPVTLISSRTSETITPATTETDARGEQTFLLTTTAPGTIILRAMDILSGTMLSRAENVDAGPATARGGRETFFPSRNARAFTAQVAEDFGDVAAFEIDAPEELQRGEEAQKITIRAVDADGRIVEDYNGTVMFTSTDPKAVLPNFGSYTFRLQERGTRTFYLSLRFEEPGDHVLRIEDASNPGIKGEAGIHVVGAAVQEGKRIRITSHHDGDSVKDERLIVEGQGPPLVNLVATGGIDEAAGETDGEGAFRIVVPIDLLEKEVTLQVQDDTGQSDSGPLHLFIDTQMPPFREITFVPTTPEAGQNVLVRAGSEPKLKKASLLIPLSSTETQEIILEENVASSGSYQAFFTAPEPGEYQTTVVLQDKAGNETRMQSMLRVGLRGLPKVLNVATEPRENAIGLTWDPVTSEPVDGYRIYVGSSEDSFEYSLDTGRITTQATVGGLTPGKIYYFAVTALKEKAESREKSETVAGQVMGLSLKVSELDGSLLVQWAFPKPMSFDSFILEYGVSAENMTEQRRLPGGDLKGNERRAATIGDLINGITYHMKLTPLSITGERLEELVATGTGTPRASGTGFTPGPGDPIPELLHGDAPLAYEPPPEIPSTGLPHLLLFTLFVIGGMFVAFHVHRRRLARSTAALLRAIQEQYHSGL